VAGAGVEFVSFGGVREVGTDYLFVGAGAAGAALVREALKNLERAAAAG